MKKSRMKNFALMKAIVIAMGLVCFGVTQVNAETQNRASQYSCKPHPHSQKNIGDIIIVGDPVKNVYQLVTINGVKQRIRPGNSEPVYLYLYDVSTGLPGRSLEVVNFNDSYESFELSVYPQHIVLGSMRETRYLCNRVK